MEITRSASSVESVGLADTIISDDGTCEVDQFMCYGGPKCCNGFILSPSASSVARACLRIFQGNANAMALFRATMMETPRSFELRCNRFVGTHDTRSGTIASDATYL